MCEILEVDIVVLKTLGLSNDSEQGDIEQPFIQIALPAFGIDPSQRKPRMPPAVWLV
jgi:hypothetical protein